MSPPAQKALPPAPETKRSISQDKQSPNRDSVTRWIFFGGLNILISKCADGFQRHSKLFNFIFAIYLKLLTKFGNA
jgi:hypothetical protein